MSSKQNNSSIQINLGLCWTCDEKVATHKEFRDALGENELTCDACHREEYPEKYEVEENKYFCGGCDYSLSEAEFNSGKGRIMFNDLEEGKYMCGYMCGVCDDRVDDPQGMFPNEEVVKCKDCERTMEELDANNIEMEDFGEYSTCLDCKDERKSHIDNPCKWCEGNTVGRHAMDVGKLGYDICYSCDVNGEDEE